MSKPKAADTYIIGQLYDQIKNTQPQTVTFVHVTWDNGKYVRTGEDIILTNVKFEKVEDGYSSGNHINGSYMVDGEKNDTYFYDFKDFFYKKEDKDQKYLANPDNIQIKAKGFFQKLFRIGGRRSRRSRKSKRIRRRRTVRRVR